jgi:hypothetical protein
MAVVVLSLALAACEEPVAVPVSTAPTSSSSVDSSGSPSGAGQVGLVGCSMTVDAAQGYRSVGGSVLWPSARLGYGGGTVRRWGEAERGRDFWSNFDAALTRQPGTEAIWWQLCTSGVAEDDFEHAVDVLEELRLRMGDVPVYVSAQPGYTDGHVCDSAGSGGPERMEELASRLVETGRVRAGPVLSPLPPDRLSDSCHASEEGRAQMGEDLVGFFDRAGLP